MKIIYTILFLSTSLLWACQEDKKPLKVEAVKDGEGPTVIVGDTTKKTLTATKIQFIDTLHDFGTIDEGKTVEYDFKFKNTGEYPLIISDAKASCGCTIPEWTKDPVLPNQEGKLKVKYNSTGKEGQIQKTVSVFANTTPEVTKIDLKVFVKVKDASMGPLKK